MQTVRIDDLEIHARWLRDHGDDAGSVHPETGQRQVDTFAIPVDIAATAVRVDATVAEIDWSDGATTTHGIDRLRDVASRPRRPRMHDAPAFTLDPALRVWSTPPDRIDRFDASVVVDDDAWRDALAHLHMFGWVAFDGAERGSGAVEALAARIGYPRPTFFGTLWEMAAGATEHADSAYAPVPLDVHTDGTYLHDAPGTIIFSQQEKGGDGGDSVLVDGFAAARELQEREPEAATLLMRYEVRGRYLEPGVHVQADRPPLRTDPDGVLRQVSFNNYDRAPVLPIPERIDDVIEAYAMFRSIMNEPQRALRLPWEPGRMLIMDNWRMLHGRTDYTGSRVFLGCYTNHEDLESAFRLAGLG
ncbi:MAG: TauD/TfdA family dioxygenase [Actinomycetota bacterium]